MRRSLLRREVKLPRISGREVVKILTRSFGYQLRWQRGSHVTLTHTWRPLATVPLHPELSKGTLLSVLRQAGISREEFLAAMDE